MQVAFAATVEQSVPLYQSITNTAEIQGCGETILRDAIVLIEPYRVYLPLNNKPCLPLYSDNFSNPSSGWPVLEDANYLFGYANGEYRILVRPTEAGAGASPDFQASDYIVSVDLRNPNGVDGSYGLAFGIAAGWSTFYTLEIYPDGWYGLYRWDPDIITLSQAYSPAINQGSASNQIKVERNGGLIKAYANGQLLTSLYDYGYTGSRYIGLVVFSYDQPNVDIRFDNFIVYPVNCGDTNSPSTMWNELPLSQDQRIFYFSTIEKGHSKHRQ